MDDMLMMVDMPADTNVTPNNASTNNTSTNNTSTNNDEDMTPTPPATSCRELQLRGVVTGIHTIAVNNRTIDVHCNMDFEGGGWMLVARSTENGAGANFGWRARNGALNDLNSPYSLGESDFPFTEILVAARNNDFTIADRAYRVSAPANFWGGCQNSPCGVVVQAVAGPCNDISMLNNAGFNSATNIYYFRDVPETELVPYGLFPQGFNTFYENCIGGELHNRRGMIFVR